MVARTRRSPRSRSALAALSALALASGLAAVGLMAPAGPALGQAEEDPGDAQPTCIEHRGEARYRGYGYQHVVIVVNGCDQDAACEVSTDVTPEVQNVTVPAGETTEVITRNGSPARAFEPQVSCTLR